MVSLKSKFYFHWLFCAVLCSQLLQAAPGDENWDSRFNQPILGPGSVWAMTAMGKELYAAGVFCKAGNVLTTNFAKWDGTNWSAWGRELEGKATSMTAIGTNIYVSGQIVPPESYYSTTAQWDGHRWTAVDTNMEVTFVAPYKEGLCLAGSAINEAGESGAQIVALNVSNRIVLGFWTNASVRTVACRGNEIVACIDYYYWSEEGQANLMRWDGTNWHGMGNVFGEVSGYGFRLYGDGQWIYAAGVFTNIAGTPATHLARWDGTNWEAFTNGLTFSTNTGIASFAMGGGRIYVSGIFGSGQCSNGWNVAEWNGIEWNVLPGSPEGRTALAVGADGVFVGGDFARVDRQVVNGIARWTGSRWENLGKGLTDVGTVNALAVQGSNVFVGGKFYTIGGISATNLARWDGTQWWAVGQGTDRPVDMLCANGNMLYAGGEFSTTDGVQTSGLSSFDGTNWIGLGSHLSFTPKKLAALGTNLFVGGSAPIPAVWRIVYDPDVIYGTFGGDSVLRWTGVGWQPVLTNLNVSGLAATASRLLVASATRYFGAPSNYLWEWQGTKFGPVSGITNPVYCLMTAGDMVYLTGGRSIRIPIPPPPPIPQVPPPPPPSPALSVNGTSAQKNVLTPDLPAFPRIPPLLLGQGIWFGRLDGTNWWQTDLLFYLYPKMGVNIGEDLFVDGFGGPLRWDGVEWDGLGSSVWGEIRAMAQWGTSLIIGGKFDCAGGKVSNGFAVWHQPPPTPRLRLKGDSTLTNAPALQPMVVSWPKAFTNVIPEESPDLLNGPWTRVKQPVSLFGSQNVITSPPPAMNITNRFFRLKNTP